VFGTKILSVTFLGNNTDVIIINVQKTARSVRHRDKIRIDEHKKRAQWLTHRHHHHHRELFLKAMIKI